MKNRFETEAQGNSEMAYSLVITFLNSAQPCGCFVAM